MSAREERIRRQAAQMARIGMSRRRFLGRTGALVGGLAIAPTVLAACGSGGGSSSSSGKSVSISNWTSYMADPLLKKFEKDTGIKLTYTEDINDNDEYFAKIRPNLSHQQSIGRDGFVFTDWMASRMINQVKWVEPLVTASFPNKSQLRAALQHPGFDPTRKYSVPWQTGMTGIAYNLKATGGKDIRTIDEYLALDGTKTALTEMRDTVGLFMLSLGAKPAQATYASAQPAFDKLAKAVDDGKIKSFTGNEYVNDLGSGNIAAALAWSGDVAQINQDNPNIRFVIPDSGGMLWSDNFMIPYTSDKANLATEFINFFYDPQNAAVLTAKIAYVSPVEGTADALRAMGGDAAKLVDNPLVIPTDASLAQLSIFGPLDVKEEAKFNQRFAQITGSG